MSAKLLRWACLCALGPACSLVLDLDRYSFEPPEHAEAGGAGSAGEAGEAGAGGSEGGAPSGGQAGAGTGGESGMGGVADCSDEATSPDCELVPVALYLARSVCPPNLLGLRVEASGEIDSMPVPTTDPATCVLGDVLVTPDQQSVVFLSGRGDRVAHTFDIDPDSLGLEENEWEQPVTIDPPDSRFDTGTMVAGPAGAGHDFLLVANDDPSGLVDGVYLYTFDRGEERGRVDPADHVELAGAFSPVVDPRGRFVYVIGLRTADSAYLGTLAFDPLAGTLTSRGAGVSLNGGSGIFFQQLAVDPGGSFLYALSNRWVASYAIDAANQDLGFYAASPELVSGTFRRMVLHPEGRFLYAIESAALYGFTVGGSPSAPPAEILELDLDDDLNNGVTRIPLSNPQDIAIDARGRRLFVTGGDGTHSFEVAPDGSLTEPFPPVALAGRRFAVLHAMRPVR